MRRLRPSFALVPLHLLNQRPPRPLPSVEDPRIAKALELLERRLSQRMRLTAIARELALSPSRFRTLFKQEVGVSFQQYLTGRRLEEATRLLETTVLRISEICQQVGWSDHANFDHTFRDRLGLSPTEYRRFHRDLPRSCPDSVRRFVAKR